MNEENKTLYRWVIEHADKLPCTVKLSQERGVSILEFMTPEGTDVTIKRSSAGTDLVTYTIEPDFDEAAITYLAELTENQRLFENQRAIDVGSFRGFYCDTKSLYESVPLHLDQMIWRRRILLAMQGLISCPRFSNAISNLIILITSEMSMLSGEPDICQIKNLQAAATA